MTLTEKLEQAVWIAHTLFNRNKVAGSTANLSFLHEGKLYITCSGSSFGTLKTEDFSVVAADGQLLEGKKPSKELPLHKILYNKDAGIQAVIHTHSFYAVMWSMEKHDNEADCVPEHTPYLKMKLGTVGLVDYAKPGSEELFAAFERVVQASDGYILKQHGPVVGGSSLMEAFNSLEELEESCKIAWHLKHFPV